MQSEPGVRAAAVLGEAASLRSQQANPICLATLYRLRGDTLSCIRTALEDADRRTSEAMLVAVTSMAVCDLWLAPKQAHDTHMRGLAQLMEARGTTVGPLLAEAISCVAAIKVTHVLHLNSVVYS